MPVSAAASADAGVRPYTPGAGAAGSGPAGGFTPEQLASAYGYDPTVGGSGQTVAVIDAYDDPKIESDLASFSSHYGLPACTKANGCFKKVGQTGSEKALPKKDTTGWSIETSLDVDTVHAVCPNCKILLVEAAEPTYEDLAVAVNEAVTLGATEVSNSYGGPEIGLGSSGVAAYDHPGVVIAAATGDNGYDSWDRTIEEEPPFQPPEMPNAPAALASVVAVGGTSLELNPDGTRASETVWNDDGPRNENALPSGFVAGGGCSTLFLAPLWQHDAAGFGASGCGEKRLEADVSADADPFTGFDIDDTYNCGAACEEFGIGKGNEWLKLGGTSLATPLISSLYALAGGATGVQYPSLTLYGHLGDPSLFDVTEGGNGFCDTATPAECGNPNAVLKARVDCEGTTACNAAGGFDGPSGVGTPNGLDGFKPLLPTATIGSTGALVAGAPVSFDAKTSSDPYPGGSIATYSWSWGDGTSASSGVSPTHTYAAAGTYTVSLTVTDSYGLASTVATQPVEIAEASLEEIEKHEQEAKEKQEREAAEAKQKKEEDEAVEAKQKQKENEAAEAAQKRQHEAEVRHEQEVAKARREEEEAKARESEHARLSAGLQEVSAFHTSVKPPIPAARVIGSTLQVNRSGVLSIRIACPAGVSSCKGTVTLRTLTAVSAGAATARASVLTVATGAFIAPPGVTKTLTLRLSAKARALLARSRSLRVRATVFARDAAGATATTKSIVTLHRAPVGAPGKH